MNETINKFCRSYLNYSRNKTESVSVGCCKIGSNYPILIQSMGTVDTNNIEEAVSQAKKIFDAGASAVRFTAQGVKEAKSMGLIREALTKEGYSLPLIADIHFNANAAFEAVKQIEKVRINPGNFVEKRGSFTIYTQEEYDNEFERLKSKFIEFLNCCKQYDRAIRIGVNHGSLSQRIMSKYGDTIFGMTASAMELLRICKQEGFHNVVVSMKSSNPATMVRAYRLLNMEMQREELNFPIHLGVTEAGEGSDGRVRSAVGIGALLNDGIGDTIRVSLTEEPQKEVPVAKMLVDYYQDRIVDINEKEIDFSIYNPLQSNRTDNNTPSIVIDARQSEEIELLLSLHKEDFIYIGTTQCSLSSERIIRDNDPRFRRISLQEISTSSFEKDTVLIAEASSPQLHRAICIKLKQHQITNPVLLKRTYDEKDEERFSVMASADLGGVLIDGFGDGIWIENRNSKQTTDLSLAILQATGRRISKAQYISCPGCGRTLYDIQRVVKEVKEKTQELKNIKIAIMGCIVNGPGEMADAHYGYVGASKGKVTLYKGKEVVEQNIPTEGAVERLLEIIKNNGDWN